MKKLAHFTKRVLIGMCGAATLTVATARAGDDSKLVVEKPASSTLDDIFDRATLYKGDENTFIQSLVFTGRLQADAAFFYPNQDDSFEELLWRRARAGFKMKFLNHFTLHSEADFNLNDTDNLYTRLTDTYIAWKASDAFNLKIGKLSGPLHHGWLDIIQKTNPTGAQRSREQLVVPGRIPCRCCRRW